MSCHVAGESASSLPFVSADQAVTWPGLPAGTNASGNSHRWDTSLAGRLVFLGGAPTASTGDIIPGGIYSGPYAGIYTIQIRSSGPVGVAQFSWSASSPGGGAGTNLTGTNVPLDAGVMLSFVDGTNVSFQTDDRWNLYVRPDLQTPTNAALQAYVFNGRLMCSTCHDQHSEAAQPFDPAARPYTTNAFGSFIGTNRHFLRIPNDSHQLCNDCHAPRVVTNAAFGSHPVALNPPVDAYHKSPGLLPVEGGSGNFGCLSCHRVHHGQDNDGKLLRVTNSVSLCTDCHTLANPIAAHFSGSDSATLWPGGKNGSLIPARTDVNDRGSCINCHAVHGWPDAAAPTNHYPHLLADFQENLCFTCHGTNGPAVKLVQFAFTNATHHPVVNTDPKRRAGRSVECEDCHNPHKAKPGSHVYTATATALRNNVTNTPSLIGVDGVYVNYSGLTNFQVISPARYTYIPDTVGVTNEYQICFKCHTGYSFPAYRSGTAAFANNSTAVTGTGTAWTTNLIGQWIANTNDLRAYVITNVTSATTLAISPSYSNVTASAQNYVIWNITPGLTALYNTGTVTFTSGSATVAGSGTVWNSGMIGTWIYNSNNPATVYKISAVAGPTSLTIRPAYAGSTASGQTYGISGDTDLAQEFSPLNRSGHPVITGLGSYPNASAPKGLAAAALKAPWNVNVGSQTMLCSDCHDTTSTNYVASAAQGPHGSAYQYLLRGPNGGNWPNLTLSTANFNLSWCANCHANSARGAHTSNHSSLRCYNCHLIIPHGGKMSRLIADRDGTMPARYAWNNATTNVYVQSFNKAASSYSDGDCRTSCGHHSSGSSATMENW